MWVWDLLLRLIMFSISCPSRHRGLSVVSRHRQLSRRGLSVSLIFSVAGMLPIRGSCGSSGGLGLGSSGVR